MENLNILEFASMFAEQHDVWISFTVGGSSGCDVHMAKNRDLESITLPRKELEIMDLDVIGSVLNYLLMRLEAKDEYCEWIKEKEIEQIGKWVIKEEENAEHKSN